MATGHTRFTAPISKAIYLPYLSDNKHPRKSATNHATITRLTPQPPFTSPGQQQQQTNNLSSQKASIDPLHSSPVLCTAPLPPPLSRVSTQEMFEIAIHQTTDGGSKNCLLQNQLLRIISTAASARGHSPWPAGSPSLLRSLPPIPFPLPACDLIQLEGITSLLEGRSADLSNLFCCRSPQRDDRHIVKRASLIVIMDTTAYGDDCGACIADCGACGTDCGNDCGPYDADCDECGADVVHVVLIEHSRGRDQIGEETNRRKEGVSDYRRSLIELTELVLQQTILTASISGLMDGNFEHMTPPSYSPATSMNDLPVNSSLGATSLSSKISTFLVPARSDMTTAEPSGPARRKEVSKEQRRNARAGEMTGCLGENPQTSGIVRHVPTCETPASSNHYGHRGAVQHVSYVLDHYIPGSGSLRRVSELHLTVAERLACAPPTMVNRAQSRRSPVLFASGNRAGRCRWPAGFLRDLSFPPAPSFRRRTILTSIILFGSQDLAVKRHPNHSIKRVKPSVQVKVLLLDENLKHTKKFEALCIDRENGTLMLSLSGHTTHCLQRLEVEVSFFKLFNTYGTGELEKWVKATTGTQPSSLGDPSQWLEGDAGRPFPQPLQFRRCSIFTSYNTHRLSRPLLPGIKENTAVTLPEICNMPMCNMPIYKIHGSTAIWAQSPAGSLQIFTCMLVGGFSRGSPVLPALLFRCCSILTSITFIGSQDLDVKSHKNLFTHSKPHELINRPILAAALCQKQPDGNMDWQLTVGRRCQPCDDWMSLQCRACDGWLSPRCRA
ncbi:hypothetical protein PR048_026811 [Dryococelus australis]|uniref:Uncharacterized protein n=1 Tax=Dryococelus australis TaxID=614101 RepID=A0ABQ9GMF1_9NEOP|nr:hypothetical protein PR048_026811 [Dryococelus australis]